MATILVVDDNDDIRELITLNLEQRGFTVISACNGAEAVSTAVSASPALILMDINMPELDGIEATTRIRGNDSEHRIPVIALTAYALPDDQQRALAAGCDAFHAKPVDFNKLFQQIGKLIKEPAPQ